MNRKKKSIKEIWVPVAAILIFILIWQLICVFELVPGFMLPSPLDVGKAFVTDFPLLMHHAGITLLEAFFGLTIGVMLGFCCAALMDTFPVVKSALYPILVLTQTIPPVAIAPPDGGGTFGRFPVGGFRFNPSDEIHEGHEMADFLEGKGSFGTGQFLFRVKNRGIIFRGRCGYCGVARRFYRSRSLYDQSQEIVILR